MDEAATRWLQTFAARRRSSAPNLDSLESCPVEALEVARIIWLRRVVNETRSAELARQMQNKAAHIQIFNAAFREALVRLEEDETAHVDLATAVLKKLNAPPINIPDDTRQFVFPDETPIASLMRLVLTGLCVCESVSAARFASVREHTDLDVFRNCIELFYRDELTHAELGFVLFPQVRMVLRDEVGAEPAEILITDELRATLGHMDRVVGLNLERKGGVPPMRPQPKPNPGVVEPAVDAAAFYRSIHEDVLPRLETLGVAARDAWKQR